MCPGQPWLPPELLPFLSVTPTLRGQGLKLQPLLQGSQGQLPPHSSLHSSGLDGLISPYSSGPLHKLSLDHPSLASA